MERSAGNFRPADLPACFKPRFANDHRNFSLARGDSKNRKSVPAAAAPLGGRRDFRNPPLRAAWFDLGFVAWTISNGGIIQQIFPCRLKRTYTFHRPLRNDFTGNNYFGRCRITARSRPHKNPAARNKKFESYIFRKFRRARARAGRRLGRDFACPIHRLRQFGFLGDLFHCAAEFAVVLPDFLAAAGILPPALPPPCAWLRRALAVHFVRAAVHSGRRFHQRRNRKTFNSFARHRRARRFQQRKLEQSARHRRRTFWNRRASVYRLAATVETTARTRRLTSKLNCPLPFFAASYALNAASEPRHHRSWNCGQRRL